MRDIVSPLSGIRSPFGERRTAFSPAALFALAEPGVWYDPSDVANLDWRRNLLTWTEQFDNAAWTKTNATVTANAGVAPDGTTTADNLIPNTTNNSHGVSCNFTSVASQYTLTIYAKANGYNWIWFNATSTGAPVNDLCWFDVANGTAGTAQTNATTSIESVGNGWYRCKCVWGAFTAGSPVIVINIAQSDNQTATWTGDGTSGVLLWGAQLEVGSTVTEYQRITDVNTEVIERFPSATLYQDTAGTTPVTTPGQSVALALDKSKGLVKTKTTLPTFTVNEGSGATTISVTSNVLTFTSAASGDGKRINGYFTLGRRVYIRVTAVGTGSVAVFAGNTTPISISSNGVFVGAIGNANADYLIFRASSGGYNGTITVEEIFEQDGFHATQATAGSRPIYGIVPVGGRRNLLTYSEDLTNAVWSATAVTKNTATKFTATATNNIHAVVQSFSHTSGVSYTYRQVLTYDNNQYVSLRILAGVFPHVCFDLVNGTVAASQSGASGTITSLGGGSYLCAITVTATSTGTGNVGVFLQNAPTTFGAGFLAVGTEAVSMSQSQLETGSTATAYQRVVSQYDVTEAGVSSLSYLAFDGVDDFLVTPTITPGVDEVQVFAGLRKLSDATAGIVAELSANTGSNAGSFYLAAPEASTAANRYSFLGRGSITAANGHRSLVDTGAAPDQAVLTGQGDISADNNLIRRNGVAFPAGTLDQGTGNYLAYPMYIGRRAGTTLPASMNLFSLIVRFGANLTADRITSTETWVNGKTRAY